MEKEENPLTFKASRYQKLFSKFNLGNVRDFVIKVHKKGIITDDEGVLILTKPTKERLNDLFIKHFDIANAKNLDKIEPKLNDLTSVLNEIYKNSKANTKPDM